MNTFEKRSIYAFIAVQMLSVGAVSAQTSSSGPDSSNNPETIKEIIVTAQKREQSLQDVPVAVTAIDSKQLEAANVQSVLDLKQVAPSLNTIATNGIYLGNSIRGVGSVGYGAGIESPVGLYVDNVYQASPFVFSSQLNNVSDVEVLKGPQGTLFGRNATGGLISIKTRTPTSTTQGSFSLSGGNYGIVQANAYIGGGITDTLAADVAFVSRTQGTGFGKNVTTGQDWDKLDHNVAVRSKWVWAPSEATKVAVIGDFFDGKGSSGGAIAFPGRVNAFSGQVSPDFGWGTNEDLQIERKIRGGGASVQITHDFGSLTFNSISAWRTDTYPLYQDIDFTPSPLGTIYYRQEDRQLSQEFQLSSGTTSALQWTAGMFYFNSKADAITVIDLFGFPPASVRLNYLDTVTAQSYAAYGQATYALGAATNVSVGTRYTREKREEKDASLGLEVAPGVIIPIQYPNRSFTAGKFTWRLSLDHRFSDQLLAYASFNTGFKSGGYNSTAPGEAPFQPEFLKAYEIGVKSDLFDRRLRANVSAFYYDYKDIQVQRIVNNSLFVINGAAAKIYGVDADFTALLSHGFSFTGGVAWTSPTFKDFPDCPISTPAGGVPLVAVGTNCQGNQLPVSAKVTFSGAINYARDIGDGRLDASTNAYYNSGLFFEPDNVIRQGGYTVVGASVKYTFHSKFSLGLFGRNLTNKRIIGLGTTQANGNVSVNWQEPRTYGATIGYEF